MVKVGAVERVGAAAVVEEVETAAEAVVVAEMEKLTRL